MEGVVETAEMTEPPDRWLAAFADILLPGGDGWPSGAAAGVHGVLAARMIAFLGEDLLDRLASALSPRGEAFTTLDGPARIAAVAALEGAQPNLFGWICAAAYHAYYESPLVAASLNAKGRLYKLVPHPTGYPESAYAAAPQMPPVHRGHYVPTHAVRRVDAAALQLDDRPTKAWDLAR